MPVRFQFCSILIALLVASPVLSDEPAANAAAPSALDGAWRVVSQRFGDADSDSPAAADQIKFVVGDRFEWTSSENGKIIAGGGGHCKIEGNTYTEHYDYIFGSDVEWLLNVDVHFTWKVEDGKWIDTGVLPTPQGDLKFSETCERLK